MTQEKLDITWDDVAELMRLNPLAAEQLKSVVLRRRLDEAERRLVEVAPPQQSDHARGDDHAPDHARESGHEGASTSDHE